MYNESIEVEHLNTGLTRELWRFWLDMGGQRLDLVLDEYHYQTRPTKRHGWKSQSFWKRVDERHNTMLKPNVPREVAEIATKKFVSDIALHLRVDSEPGKVYAFWYEVKFGYTDTDTEEWKEC